jgi:hypothetical protein
MRSTIRIRVAGLVAACCLAVAGCATRGTAHEALDAQRVKAQAQAARQGRVSAAAGITWARKVRAGVTVSDIEDAFASVAAEDNIRAVGDLPLSKELELRSGKPGKFLKVYSYCDPAAARIMVDFNPAMAALLPCRIAVVEQEDGLWIYTMDMDMLINMQGELPPQVGDTVSRVRATILKMLERGARGEF